MKKTRLLPLLLLALTLLPLSAPAQETVTLRTCEWIDESTLAAFTREYPHIQVEMVESGLSIQESILTGAEIDVFSVQAAGAWAEILKKGYAAPLEGDALMEKARRLLPSLQAVVFQGAQLMAFPQSLSLVTWTVDLTAWEEAGFSSGELPGTLDEFLACYEKWRDTLAENLPDRYFFEGGSLEYVTQVIVRQYIAAHESPDAAVSFDTPAFRDALGLLEQSRPLFREDDALAQARLNGEIESMPLIYNYGMSYGYTGLDSHIARPLAIPALSKDTPAFTEGEAYLYFVNARSRHPREAALLVNFLAEGMSIDRQYEIYADLDQPVENPRYPELKARFTAELADVEAKVKNCKPEEKQALEDRLSWLKNWMSREDELRWVITQADIDLHHCLTKRLSIPIASRYLAEDSNCYEALGTLIRRFADGEMDKAALIAEMDRTCKLAYLEQ